MTASWAVGDVRITKVAELEIPAPLRRLLSGVDDGAIDRHRWLYPDFVDAGGRARLSVHALLVETPAVRVLVDTCIGDRRDGMPLPAFESRFLGELAAAGCGVDDVDIVVCTHLHFDHVGWNTRRVDGRWRVTFPRARYVITRAEWERRSGGPADIRHTIDPLAEAGVLDLVDGDHQVCGGLRLAPAPGHTPGHVSVRIADKGQVAFVTGDLMHHPLQVAEPRIGSPQDADPALAERTRRKFLADRAADGALVIGTHFAGPSAGYVVAAGDSYRFVTDPTTTV